MTGKPVLAHRVDGAGEPLLLLNGGMMSISSWDPIVGGLAARFRVVRCDFRGQLRSNEPPHRTLDGHVADVVDLLDALAIDRAHVVGTSFGAEVGLLLAATHPGRVASLVAATATGVATPLMRDGGGGLGRACREAAAGRMAASVGEIIVPAFYSPAYAAAHRDELAARAAQIALLPPWWFAAAAELLASIEDLDLRPVLGRIACPVLVLAAEGDLVMPLAQTRALAAAIPDARLEVVAGSGHVLVVEQPERFVRSCLDFLASVSRYDGRVDRAPQRIGAVTIRREDSMRKPVYIAAYHQSKFGKLMGMQPPEIIANAVKEVCAEIKADPAAMDVGSVGAVCNVSLNKQGLLSGLMAMVPGLAAKPIDAVENACATGGQAILSVIHKLLVGDGEVGIAVGYEKMRDNDGKMDGKLIGEVLGYFSHPDERAGKVFIFPHLFAEVMDLYMKTYGVKEEDLAQIAVNEYANAKYNPYAQMQKVQPTLEQAMKIEGINRYVVEGLPLKTYDCSQITDGYAAMIVATEEGLKRLGVAKADTVEIAGYAQATDPLMKAGRDVLRPAAAYAAMGKAYAMAGATSSDVNVAEVHDCFTVMAAIAAEVLGKAPVGKGAQYWVDGKAAVGGECGINTS
ncbi:MAG: alpha/beta fold hydrolase, partial [Thermoanaerobaculaceae bacterium]|nr:alpha/beta fold hydrolase [Thermoanaerobaculaceae bacterium]